MIPQLQGLNREQRRSAIMELEKDNQNYPERLIAQPNIPKPPNVSMVYRSREFLVQEYQEAGGIVRLTVNRTHVDPQTMRWLDGITWDELLIVKR